MYCPHCNYTEDKVIDSRTSLDGYIIRRRRECLKCGYRFTTYEKIEKAPLKVVKKDKRRENFSKEKLLSGIMTACEKRPVSVEQIENLVDEIVIQCEKTQEKEISSNAIGELVMQSLQKIDEIAYVRFASVYRQFKDINQLMDEMQSLVKNDKKNTKKTKKNKSNKRK